jgi:thioredoxin reductase
MRYILLESLKAHGVHMLAGVESDQISDDGVSLHFDGQSRFLKADHIVLAAGYLPDDALFRTLKEKGQEVYALGDCVEPRSIFNAIHEGSAIARSL